MHTKPTHPIWTPLHLLLLLHYYVLTKPTQHLTGPEIRSHLDDLVRHGLLVVDDGIADGYRATPRGRVFIDYLQRALDQVQHLLRAEA